MIIRSVNLRNAAPLTLSDVWDDHQSGHMSLGFNPAFLLWRPGASKHNMCSPHNGGSSKVGKPLFPLQEDIEDKICCLAV